MAICIFVNMSFLGNCFSSDFPMRKGWLGQKEITGLVAALTSLIGVRSSISNKGCDVSGLTKRIESVGESNILSLLSGGVLSIISYTRKEIHLIKEGNEQVNHTGHAVAKYVGHVG